MARISYTSKTLQYLKNQGVLVGVVERWNQYVGVHGIRQDLFGFIDIIAAYPGRGIVAVQCTGPNGHSQHKKKILDECTDNAIEWLKSGGEIELWSWRKLLTKRGGKQRRWQPRIEQITLKEFE